jgi:hypothetical protein
MTQDQVNRLKANEQTLAYLEAHDAPLADALKEALKDGDKCMVQGGDGGFYPIIFSPSWKNLVYRLPADFALPIERNADGDSLEDLHAVWQRCGIGSLERRSIVEGDWLPLMQWPSVVSVYELRIAAKAAPKQEETEDMPIVVSGQGNARYYACNGMRADKWPTRAIFVCFVFADGSTSQRFRKDGGEVAVAVRVRKV